MNQTIEVMHSHRSCRKYTAEPVSDGMLDQIVEAAHRGPTSVNGQQVSLVVVRDPARRARIAELAGGQPWIVEAPVFIVVLMDFHKTSLGVEKAGQTQVIHESTEGLLVGAVDAGIALGNLMTAAHALGLGVVPIGSVRREPQGLIDLLQLPQRTFPVVGVCIGHAAQEPPQKPRLDIASFRHDERYHADGMEALIDAYDESLTDYWRRNEIAGMLSWSANVARCYQSVYFPEVKPVSIRQGFTNEK